MVASKKKAAMTAALLCPKSETPVRSGLAGASEEESDAETSRAPPTDNRGSDREDQDHGNPLDGGSPAFGLDSSSLPPLRRVRPGRLGRRRLAGRRLARCRCLGRRRLLWLLKYKSHASPLGYGAVRSRSE